MTLTQIIDLAVVQGLTEFLPVSSSGHLVLVPSIFGWTDQGLTFDVAVHFGSLIAVCVYFRYDILGLLQGAAAILSGNYASPEARMRGVSDWVRSRRQSRVSCSPAGLRPTFETPGLLWPHWPVTAF